MTDAVKPIVGIVMGLSLIHISEPTRRTPISYAVFCLKKKNNTISYTHLQTQVLNAKVRLCVALATKTLSLTLPTLTYS